MLWMLRKPASRLWAVNTRSAPLCRVCLVLERCETNLEALILKQPEHLLPLPKARGVLRRWELMCRGVRLCLLSSRV